MKLGEKVIDEGTQFLRSEIPCPPDALEFTNRLPHFEADLTTYGVQFFNNFEQAECLQALLASRVHPDLYCCSVSESPDQSLCKPIVLQIRSPIIIGVAYCKGLRF